MEYDGVDFYIHAIYNRRNQGTSYYIRISPDFPDTIYSTIISPDGASKAYEAVFLGSELGFVSESLLEEGYQAYSVGQSDRYNDFDSGLVVDLQVPSYSIWSAIEDSENCMRDNNGQRKIDT